MEWLRDQSRPFSFTVKSSRGAPGGDENPPGGKSMGKSMGNGDFYGDFIGKSMEHDDVYGDFMGQIHLEILT